MQLFHSTTTFLCIRTDSVTISWTPDSFQLPNQTTDPSRPTKKTWSLKWNKYIAEYLLTIQVLLILEENSIPIPCHQPVCSEWRRNDETGFLRKQHLNDGKEWRGQKKQNVPYGRGKERDITDQIRIWEQSVPLGQTRNHYVCSNKTAPPTSEERINVKNRTL